jgi:hypothetical protein
VKPNQEELAREQALRSTQASAAETAQQEADVKSGKSQEEAYWSRRQKELLNENAPTGETSPAQQQLRPNSPSQPPQQTIPSVDQRRALERAQAQYYEGDYATGLPLDVFGMQRVGPDQLSSVLSAQGAGRSPLSPASQLDLASMSTGASSMVPNAGAMAGAIGAPGMTSMTGMGSPAMPGYDYGTSMYPYSGSQQSQRRLAYPPVARQDQPILHRRPNPYADVPSLYDLYSQYSRGARALDRFGMDVFRNGTGNFDELPMDVPAGPDYVLGPGDGVSVDLWGGVSQRLRRVVDREGKLALPEVGTIQVTGRTLGDVQHLVQTALRSQFRNVEADVSLSRLRTVRIYVVGDVQYPGAYDVSSLSTV